MRKLLTAFTLLIISFASKSQNVGIGTSNPNPSAKLEISSNNSGFLPPRMTSMERDSIQQPASGLMIYNTTTDCLQIFSKGRWQNMFCGTNDTTIVTDSTIVTDIDGNTYPTVKICNQTWMAKNLSVARYRNGDPIPQVTDPTQWANLTTGAWCWYNNDSAAYGATYGRLYNWYAVNDPRGLAPAGWHVPSENDWNKFTKCLDINADTNCSDCIQSNIAGGKMKTINYWRSPNQGATNESGFSAVPSGALYHLNGNFNNLGSDLLLMSSSSIDQNLTWLHTLRHSDAYLYKGSGWKKDGLSVRCIKDTPGTSLNNGLVAYYPFNGNANDESGNGNHGTVNGASLTTDRFGSSGKAYSFDGASNITTNNLPLISQAVTISGWININAYSSAGRRIINQSNFGYSNSSFSIAVLGSPHPTGTVFEACFSNGNQTSNYVVPLNTDIHFVASIDNGVSRIFINGQQVLMNTGLAPLQMSNSGLQIGGSSMWIFNGKIDDIRIYNRALTQEEITYLATH